MKTNYTVGRRVNLKLNKTDGTTYFEFINVSLTKTGLNDKVRTISTSGAVIGTSTLIGLTSETRDKIINNLHPEVCRVKVPFSGTCNQLFHCDDNGQNCTERTTASGTVLLDSSNCIWQVPFCEFSTYREATSSGSSSGSSSSSSGGGGGGGGAIASKNKTTEKSEEEAPSSGGETGEEGPVTEREEGETELPTQEREREEVNIMLWIIPVVIVIFGIVVAVYFGMKSGKKQKAIKFSDGKI